MASFIIFSGLQHGVKWGSCNFLDCNWRCLVPFKNIGSPALSNIYCKYLYWHTSRFPHGHRENCSLLKFHFIRSLILTSFICLYHWKNCLEQCLSMKNQLLKLLKMYNLFVLSAMATFHILGGMWFWQRATERVLNVNIYFHKTIVVVWKSICINCLGLLVLF